MAISKSGFSGHEMSLSLQWIISKNKYAGILIVTIISASHKSYFSQYDFTLDTEWSKYHNCAILADQNIILKLYQLVGTSAYVQFYFPAV